MRKTARIFFASIVFIPFCLIIPIGLRSLWVWARIHLDAHYYHSNHFFFFLALYTLIPGALATWIIFLVALGRKSWAWLALPALIAFFLLIQLSDSYLSAESIARVHLMNVARASSLVWVKKTGHLPDTPEDIELSIEQFLYGSKERMSPYGLGRDRIPYKFVVVKGASGPLLDISQAQQPGLIFYALSADGSQAWITGTGLDGEFSGPIHFLRKFRARREAGPAIEIARVNAYQVSSE